MKDIRKLIKKMDLIEAAPPKEDLDLIMRAFPDQAPNLTPQQMADFYERTVAKAKARGQGFRELMISSFPHLQHDDNYDTIPGMSQNQKNLMRAQNQAAKVGKEFKTQIHAIWQSNGMDLTDPNDQYILRGIIKLLAKDYSVNPTYVGQIYRELNRMDPKGPAATPAELNQMFGQNESIEEAGMSPEEVARMKAKANASFDELDSAVAGMDDEDGGMSDFMKRNSRFNVDPNDQSNAARQKRSANDSFAELDRATAAMQGGGKTGGIQSRMKTQAGPTSPGDKFGMKTAGKSSGFSSRMPGAQKNAGGNSEFDSWQQQQDDEFAAFKRSLGQ